jgi:hypothetical protein
MKTHETDMNIPRDLAVPLQTIASQANREHELATAAAYQALEHAVRCGELLAQAKAELGHGNFLPWLKANFAGSERTARNYMQLSLNRQRVADLGCDSIRGALAALADRVEPVAYADKIDDPLKELEIPAPFEIPFDHGLFLGAPGEDNGFAIFTPYTDVNFVFVSSLENSTFVDADGNMDGWWVCGRRAIARKYAWWSLLKMRPGVNWSAADDIWDIPSGHEWAGPWEYNQILYYSREEYMHELLGEHPRRRRL